MTAALVVADVRKAFGGVQALKGVSLTLEEGQLLGLIGPNGSGKTTLLNLVSGTLRPTSGTITFDGRRIDRLPANRVVRAGIAKTHQIPKPFLAMTARENVAVAAMYGARRSDNPRVAFEASDHVLSLVGMDRRSDVQAGRLTVQERKRLELARALATGARIILMDEVFTGLSPDELRTLMALFSELRAELRFGALVVEHVMRAVLTLAERVAVLEEGRLIAEGTPKEVVENRAVIDAYLGQEAVRAPT